MARLFRVLVPALVLGLAFAACGDDDDQPEQSSEPQAAQSAELGAIKDYLLEHTERLVDDTAHDPGRRRGLLRARQGRGLRLREAARRATARRCSGS